MTGEASFLEIGVPNGRRTRDFYQALFGWNFHEMGGDNVWIETPTVRAGVHPNDDDATIVVYFRVADIDAAVERVRELGGAAGEPGPEDRGFGRFVECRDNQGVRFGLHQPPAG